MKILLYCTKTKPYLTRGNDGSVYPSCVISDGIQEWHLNGKIVAECDFEVEEIIKDISSVVEEWYSKELLNKSCLTAFELDDYLKGKNGYAIHIKNLHIFDEPKELNKYKRKDEFMGGKQVFWETIKKAPQNMMFAYDNEEKKILISIQPQWLCKILNGEKTIEVRKQVLKEMLG